VAEKILYVVPDQKIIFESGATTSFRSWEKQGGEIVILALRQPPLEVAKTAVQERTMRSSDSHYIEQRKGKSVIYTVKESITHELFMEPNSIDGVTLAEAVYAKAAPGIWIDSAGDLVLIASVYDRSCRSLRILNTQPTPQDIAHERSAYYSEANEVPTLHVHRAFEQQFGQEQDVRWIEQSEIFRDPQAIPSLQSQAMLQRKVQDKLRTTARRRIIGATVFAALAVFAWITAGGLELSQQETLREIRDRQKNFESRSVVHRRLIQEIQNNPSRTQVPADLGTGITPGMLSAALVKPTTGVLVNLEVNSRGDVVTRKVAR
jgi:hypothetical protein